jgi:hypothetical protein
MRRVVLLAACLGMAACGGGGAQSPPSHGGGADHAAASQSGAPASGDSVVDRCVAKADGDPAEMMLCLATHHVQVSDSIRTCVSGVRESAQLIACMRKFSR